MDFRGLCTGLCAALVLVVLNDLGAYRGYVPIRPANTIRPIHEPLPYTAPGIISLHNTWWDGHDNLAEIPQQLRIYTEVCVDPNSYVWLPVEEAQCELEKELKFVGIDIRPPLAKPDDPYRTLLSLQVFVLPCCEGYAVQINLRLFEKDETFKRGKPQGHEFWQVITWEKQCMFIAATGGLICAVRDHVSALAGEFTRQYLLDKKNKEAADKGKIPPMDRNCSSNCTWRWEWDCCR